MARYKVLKSVAHSLAHSFTSLMNYRDNDYVLGHILRRARETGDPQLRFDVLTGEAAPASLVVPPVRDSLDGYMTWFPQLVKSHMTSMDVVRSAVLTLTFDLERHRPVRGQPSLEESPFRCVAEIMDDRGTVWASEVNDWWYPEAGEAQSMSEAAPIDPRNRLGRLIRSIWRRR